MLMSPFAFFLVLGIALISVELLVFQLSVFWLLLVGLGALISALAVWLLTSDSWLVATAVFVAATVIIGVLAYRPLQRWQQKPALLAGHDALGQTVSVVKRVDSSKQGVVLWSGAKWAATLAGDSTQVLQPGDNAEIAAIHGIVLSVRPVGTASPS